MFNFISQKFLQKIPEIHSPPLFNKKCGKSISSNIEKMSKSVNCPLKSSDHALPDSRKQ